MTVTDSHSALHSADEAENDTLQGPNASVRAPAREGTESTAQSNPQSADTDSDENLDLWAWISDIVSPPDIWNVGRSALADARAYADRGEWTSRGGIPRRCGQVYFWLFSLPVRAVLAYLDWIIERPSRLAAAALLMFVLAQFPPVSWLI